VFFNGTEAPRFTMEQIELLKEYILQGGFYLRRQLLQERAVRRGVSRPDPADVPPSEAPLKKLTAEHPVFRSEFNLLDEKRGSRRPNCGGSIVGCRTSIIYSPHDVSCLWDKWTSFDIPTRPKELLTMITKGDARGSERRRLRDRARNPQ